MAEQNITTSFKVDISDLKKGINDANNILKTNKSELNAVNSEMLKTGKSSSSMKKAYDIMSKSLEAQNSKLESYQKQLQTAQKYEKEASQNVNKLKQALEQAKNQYGANSDEVKNYQKQLSDAEKVHESMKKQVTNLSVQLNNQKAVINKAEKELGDYEQQIKDVQKAEKMSAKTGKSVEESLKDIADASKKADSEVEKLGDGFTTLKGTMANLIADGIKGFVSWIGQVASESQEMTEDMGKLETAFTNNGHSVETAQKTYEDFVGILGETDQSVEAVNHLARLTQSTEELSKWTDIASGIYATFGDSLPIEGLTEAANETAKVGQVTGPLADALNWAGLTAEDLGLKLKANTKANLDWNKTIKESTSAEDLFNLALSECSTEQERSALITETLNSLYEDAGKNYQEVNKDLIASRKATSDYNQAMKELGDKALPITTAIKEGFTEILNAGVEMISGLNTEELATKIKEGFQYFIDEILPKIKDGFKWIIDNKDVIIAGIVGIGTAMLVLNVSKMIMGLVGAFQAFNLVLMANPIGLVVAAITGLVAGFVYLWNTSEGFRNFWIGLWEYLKKACKDAINNMIKLFNQVGEFFVDLWTGAKDIAIASFKAVKKFFVGIPDWFDSNVTQPIGNFFSEMWENVKQKASDTWSGIKSVFSTVGKFFKDTFTDAWTSVKNVFSTGGKIFDGIKEGIVDSFKIIVNGIIKGINKVVKIPFDGINTALSTIKNISIAGATPFDWISTITVPQIPELAKGGVLEKGQVGLLEGTGAEAVVPLENNSKWIKKVADEFKKQFTSESNGYSGKGIIDSLGSTINIKNVTKQLAKNVSATTEDIIAELLNQIQKQMDTAKIYTDISLANELEYWNKARKMFKEGTEERIEADRTYFELKDKMLDELTKLEEEHDKELEKIEEERLERHKELLEQQAELTETYHDKIASIESSYKSQIEALWDNYYSKVEARASQVFSTFGLFDEANAGLKVNGNALIRNLDGQVKLIEQYASAMQELDGKNISDALMSELKSMDVNSLNKIQAILSMTNEELEKYDKLYNDKLNLSNEIAKSDYKDLYNTTASQVATLKRQEEREKEKATEEYERQQLYIARQQADNIINSNKAVENATNTYGDAIGNLTGQSAKVTQAKNNLNTVNTKISSTSTNKASSTPLKDTVVSAVNNFTQVINSPTSLSRNEIYRNTKNLLATVKGG